MIKEYRTIQEIASPLMVVNKVRASPMTNWPRWSSPTAPSAGPGAGGQRRHRRGPALRGPPAGINLAQSKVRFLGHPLQLAVSGDMLGRVFNGMGEPIDGGPAILAEEYRDINGLPMNPAARDYPNEFIQTGISTIDGLNTLVRGRSCPFSRLRPAPRPAGGPDCL